MADVFAWLIAPRYDLSALGLLGAISSGYWTRAVTDRLRRRKAER